MNYYYYTNIKIYEILLGKKNLKVKVMNIKIDTIGKLFCIHSCFSACADGVQCYCCCC